MELDALNVEAVRDEEAQDPIVKKAVRKVKKVVASEAAEEDFARKVERRWDDANSIRSVRDPFFDDD